MVEKHKSDTSGMLVASKSTGKKSSMPKLALIPALSWLCHSKILVVLAIASLASTPVGADDKPLVEFLNVAVKEDGSMTYSVMPGVDLLLSFTGASTTDTGTALEFYLTPFSGEQGDNLAVESYIVELPKLKPKDQRLSFLLDRPVMTLKLKVPELPTAGKYSGSLVVLQEGRVRQTHPIVLTRAKVQRPAQLTIDVKSITVHYTKSCLLRLLSLTCFEEPPNFTMFVRNSSPEWQAKGVFLRLLEVTTPKGANFDPGKNLTLTWNGQKADDLWRSQSPKDVDTSPRVIAPNEQAEVGGEFRDLAPGEYTIKLGLAATNAVPESEQQMIVKVEVRHGVFWAVVVLLAAIAISFITDKGLEAQRNRVALLRKISEIRPPWLREEPPTLPVVSVRAMLKQAEDRSKTWYTALFGPDVVSHLVSKAAQMLGSLRRVRQIRERIKRWNQDTMIRNRGEKWLRDIVADLGPGTVDEKFAAEIETKLDELEKWFIPDQLYDLYWPDLKSDINSLLVQAKPEDFPVQQHQDIVVKLRQRIEKEPQNQNLSEATKIEEDYAKLKILWERQQDDDKEALNQLVALFEGGQPPSINNFFKKADDIAWGRLKKACEMGKDGLEFTSPQESTIHPLRAYQLIQFEVAPKDRKLGNNYLFKHGLEYRWSLDLETKKGTEKLKLTRPKTKEPRLVQYVPRKEKLHVSVKLCRNGVCSKEVKMKDPLSIEASSDFSWSGAFQFVEVTALAIATLIALVSGLATFYINKPSFGNVGDYIALFLWGAGIDKAKNFIQHLERTSPAKGSSS